MSVDDGRHTYNPSTSDTTSAVTAPEVQMPPTAATAQNPQMHQPAQQNNYGQNIQPTNACVDQPEQPSSYATSQQSYTPYGQKSQESAQQYGQYGQYGAPAAQATTFSNGYGTVIPLHPLNIGETLDALFRLLKYNPVAYFLFPMILMLATSVISSLIAIVSGEVSVDTLLGNTIDVMSSIAGPSVIVELILGIFVSFAIIVVGTRITVASVRGRKVSLKESFAMLKPRAGKTFLALFGYEVLLLVAMIVAIATYTVIVIAIVGTSFITESIFDSNALSVGSIIAVILVTLVFTLTLATVYIRIALTPSVIVAESAGSTKAIARSWNLTKGSFWYLVGTNLIVWMLVSVVMSMLSLIIGVIVGLFLVSNDGTMSAIATLVSSMGISLTISIAVTPLQCALANLLYVNMRFRRENFHLNLIAEREGQL